MIFSSLIKWTYCLACLVSSSLHTSLTNWTEMWSIKTKISTDFSFTSKSMAYAKFLTSKNHGPEIWKCHNFGLKILIYGNLCFEASNIFPERFGDDCSQKVTGDRFCRLRNRHLRGITIENSSCNSITDKRWFLTSDIFG